MEMKKTVRPSPVMCGSALLQAPSNFGIIPYGCTEADLAFVPTAKLAVGWIYIQSDVMPNPWDSLPAYLGALVAALR